MLVDRISDEDTIAFLESAFRNVEDMPVLSRDDLKDIADALFFFAIKHGPR